MNQNFTGNPDDLEQFFRVARSQPRTPAREIALREWENYKLGREKVLKRKRGKRRVVVKTNPYHFERPINLAGANLSISDGAPLLLGHINLYGADLSGANLRGVWLKRAKLERANLREADLCGAHLPFANLRGADLTGATLSGADLSGADLTHVCLDNAILENADLSMASIVGGNLSATDLTGSRVYGVSAWDVRLDSKTKTRDLIITPPDQPTIAVDDLKVAQFTYLLLSNANIRDVIQTIGYKAVLLLGRFSPERKAILDGLRWELRRLGWIPILFDFDKPLNRTFKETVVTLAGLTRFIIADITSPKSIPLELDAIVPVFDIPVVPIIAEGQKEFAMMETFGTRKHVLPVLEYSSLSALMNALEEHIIVPATRMSDLLADEKKKALPRIAV